MITVEEVVKSLPALLKQHPALRTEIFEIKSYAEEEDIERFNDKAELARMKWDLKNVVKMNAEILENYPDDPRGPSCLVLGYSRGRAIHVVCGRTIGDWLLVITVYIPGPLKWTNARTRAKRGDINAA